MEGGRRFENLSLFGFDDDGGRRRKEVLKRRDEGVGKGGKVEMDRRFR